MKMWKGNGNTTLLIFPEMAWYDRSSGNVLEVKTSYIKREKDITYRILFHKSKDLLISSILTNVTGSM
jgi:hypothetical protein